MQYYHLELSEKSAKLTATLAAGLPDDSRTKMKLSGDKISLGDAISALTVDRITDLTRALGGYKGNGPDSLYKALTGTPAQTVQAFDSVESFEEARRRILGG